MANRVTQVVAEAVASGNPKARLTQVAAEVLALGLPSTRLTQLPVEILVRIFEIGSVGNVMPLPVFPIANTRGLTWSVVQRPVFSTLTNETTSGRLYRTPLWKNPRYEFEFTWGYLKANPADILAGNAPYTDFDIWRGFFLAAGGSGQDFVYAPEDSVQNVSGGAQALATPDSNNNTELTINRGGQFFESIQELNGASPQIYVSGTLKTNGVDYNVLAPASVVGYDGYVINWLVSPGVNPITANYTYFYRCQFATDSADLEEFMFQLYELKKIVIRQVRV